MSSTGRIREQLWELVQVASQYLRRHASPAVRLATALLLAASLAACNASASDSTMVQTGGVAPLTQEVVSGLPRGPGTFQVVPGSVFRDQRGVYQFEWLDPGQTSGPGHVAHVSRLRLVRNDALALEMPAGTDPILHLPQGENVGLIQQAQVGAAQPGAAYYPPPYSYWSPFSLGPYWYARPTYYDPPRVVIVERPPSAFDQRGGSGGAIGGSGGGATAVPHVDGGTASDVARPAAQRVTGVQSAVSGRAGGTGAGNAVTSRNVASGASRATSGNTGGSGAGSTNGSSTGASSGARSSSGGGGSVSAPRSGGFSSGVGSAGGGSAS